jgi:hypothetical protein
VLGLPNLTLAGAAVALGIDFSGSGLVTPPAMAENLALGASYTFSRQPDYEPTADAGDRYQLTDGKYVSGTMWTSKEGVGWRADEHSIAIEIDLRQQQRIGQICLRTARQLSAGVSYPLRVDLFTSSDRIQYAWNGRLQPWARGGDGEYAAHQFCSPDVGREARFVRVDVKAKGAYFMTDEISVLRSTGSTLRPTKASMAPDKLAAFALEQEAMSVILARLLTNYDSNERTQSAAMRLREVAAELEGRHEDLDLERLAALGEEIRHIVRDARRAMGASVQISRADPWLLATPVDGAMLTDPSDTVDVPAGGHGAVVVAVEHAQAQTVRFDVSASLEGDAAQALAATFYEVAFVTRADGVRLGDPLMPLMDGHLDVRMGETRQIWVDVRARPDAPTAAASLTVRLKASIAGSSMSRSLQVPLEVYTPPKAAVHPSTVVWGYLDWRPIRNRAAAAVEDMLSHGVTTAVIPAWHGVPWPKLAATTASREIGDYRLFDATMRTLSGHGEYLFFLALNSDSPLRSFNRRYEFLSEGWKSLFVAWIAEWSHRLRAAGYGYDAFAFYPVDEPHEGVEQEMLIEVAGLIKKADPRLRVYATVHDPAVLSDRLVSAVDVFQLNGPALSAETVQRLRREGKTVRSYATTGGGKAGDPAAFYRAQAWQAFALGFDGFGFWAYADTGRSGSAWSDIDDVRPDFAVIYESPGGIVSSKRWEAWREGVQDYALLAAAAAAAHDATAQRSLRGLATEGLAQIANGKALARIRRQVRDIALGRE